MHRENGKMILFWNFWIWYWFRDEWFGFYLSKFAVYIYGSFFFSFSVSIKSKWFIANCLKVVGYSYLLRCNEFELPWLKSLHLGNCNVEKLSIWLTSPSSLKTIRILAVTSVLKEFLEWNRHCIKLEKQVA